MFRVFVLMGLLITTMPALAQTPLPAATVGGQPSDPRTVSVTMRVALRK